METEHIVENRADGTTDRTTIVRESQDSSGSSTWIVLLAILVLAAVAFFAFSPMNDAEVAKDNAVEEAAVAVDNAADNVGAAASEVGEAVEQGVDSLAE